MSAEHKYRFEHLKGEGIPYINGLDVGNCTAATLAIAVEQNKIANRRGGGGDLYADEKVSSVEVSLTLHDIRKDNLAIALRAAIAELAEATFTDVEVVALAGRLVEMDRIADITDVEVKIGAAEYRDAVEGEDYTRNAAGIFSLVDGTFKLGGTYPATERVQALHEASKEYQVTLVFANELVSGQRVVLKMHKVTFAPAATLELMSDTYVSFELKGTVLADPSKLGDESKFFFLDKTKRAIV